MRFLLSLHLPAMRLRRICARAVLLSLLAALAPPVSAQDATYGLDTRPSNTTCLPFPRPDGDASVRLEPAFPQLSITLGMVVLVQPPHDSSYWLFGTDSGVIGRFANQGNVSSWELVLNLANVITQPYDGGLVQIVFHPDFPTDPRVFLNYAVDGAYDEPDDIRISSFQLSADGRTVVPGSEKVLITQPRGTYHQGGFMAFGNDGLLYIGLGDGTNQYPQNRPEDPRDLRGDILRIDVDNVPPGAPYGIPSGPLGNPYAGNPRCGPVGNTLPCPEIFARGFRNPFRGDIDRVNGEIWVADVGYTQREEVSKVVRDGNYGWSVCEGFRRLADDGVCNEPGLINPVLDYTHSDGNCAIIGGAVYRGSGIPSLQGRYLFADYCTSKISSVAYDQMSGAPYEEILIPGGSSLGRITTFGVARNGEHYVVAGSSIYRLVADGGGGTAAPSTLTATGCFQPAAGGGLSPAPGLIPFEVQAALWSDGAAKRRWIALPDGARISRAADGDFLFPPGTMLLKEFSYAGVPHETRIFQRHLDGGWTGYSYQWRGDGSNADLLPAGKVVTLPTGQTWTYPSRAECLRCHTPEANFSLGPEIAQLNASLIYPQTGRMANQLSTLEHIGLFDTPLPAPVDSLPALAGLDQTHVPIARRARSYLHGNCSGCHRPGQATQAPMDFRFSTPTPQMQACDVAPVFGFPGFSSGSPPGLVAYYPFDEGAGSTVSDESTNSNNGSISGATWTTSGRRGSALNFDGVNDRVNVADHASLDLTTGMTLSAWFRPVAGNTNAWRTGILKETSGDLVYTLYAYGTGARAQGGVGPFSFARDASTLPNDVWTHVAVTFNGSVVRFYRNGALVESVARTAPIPVSTGALRIGGNAIWGDEYFRGRIDEVRIYNRALEATEIAGDIARADLPPNAVEAKILSPGNPSASVLWLRDGTREPLWQMPPLGTSIAHDAWLSLATQWISDPAVCNTHGDADQDGVTDEVDNCPALANASQRDDNKDGVGDACGPCNDGIDNDGDGRIDYRSNGTGDLACASATSVSEVTQCQDGLDNDARAGIDFDGGASLDRDGNGYIDAQFNPATPRVGAPDPQCKGPTWRRETPSCGLGAELAFLLGPLAWLRRRRSLGAA